MRELKYYPPENWHLRKKGTSLEISSSNHWFSMDDGFPRCRTWTNNEFLRNICNRGLMTLREAQAFVKCLGWFVVRCAVKIDSRDFITWTPLKICLCRSWFGAPTIISTLSKRKEGPTPQETANSAEKKIRGRRVHSFQRKMSGLQLCVARSQDRDVGMLSLMQSLQLMELRWSPAFFRRVMNLISISLILKQPWGYGYHQVPKGPSTMGSFTPGKIHSWPVKTSIFLTKRHTQANSPLAAVGQLSW